MKKTGLNEYAYEFNVNYKDISRDDITKNISSIQNFLMAKYNMK